MIDALHVSNVALIKEATIEPAAGLTVLTGETGTGKSALLSSLKLLMGERADAGAVREGADCLEVEGQLFLGADDAEGSVVRRRVEAGGRGRVTIDGHLSSVRELAEGVGASIDICGQHEHQRLLQVASHVTLLDAFAGAACKELLATYQEALKAAHAAQRELERVQELARSASDKVDEAAFVLGRIDEVDPREGELEELEEALPVAEHAESLLRSAQGAREGLSGDEGVCDVLSSVVQELRGEAAFDQRLGALAGRIESALIDLEDAAGELRDYEDSVDLDEESLVRMQERMAQLQGLMRTYGPRMQDVFERRDQAQELVSAARSGDKQIKRAQRARDAAEAQLVSTADALDKARKAAAPELSAAVGAQMAFLEMGTASIEVAMERLPRTQWSAQGPSKVELMYRPAAGLTARPLRRIASGGEISRVMLACKVVLGDADDTQTLVFDEVDAGVGGSTAVALAQVLARLAKTHQVLVVTHLAQVAVMAERHYLVSKRGGEVPETSIVPICGDERVAEIARMLSGDASEASLAHARQMLDRAEAERAQL